jgi:uncharacterized membrane protein YciS (DUF1049 family)
MIKYLIGFILVAVIVVDHIALESQIMNLRTLEISQSLDNQEFRNSVTRAIIQYFVK